MRDEFLNGEIFDTMWEVEVLTKEWVLESNTKRPHSSIGYRPPAPQVIVAYLTKNPEQESGAGQPTEINISVKIP